MCLGILLNFTSLSLAQPTTHQYSQQVETSISISEDEEGSLVRVNSERKVKIGKSKTSKKLKYQPLISKICLKGLLKLD